jgi:hypothetical protein
MIENVSVGVFICESLKKDCTALKETFLKYFKNYLFFGVNDDISMPCYTHEKVEGDDYNSALSKHFLCLKTQYELHNNCEWFYIGGVDIFLHPENVCNLLQQFNPKQPQYIGGHCDHRTINGKKIWFGSGGPGIFLSKALMDIIYPKLESYIDEWKQIWSQNEYCIYAGCDVATAFFINRDTGLEVTKTPGFYHLNYYEYFNANPSIYPEGMHLFFELVDSPIAFHNLKPSDQVRDLYERALNGIIPFDKCKKLSILN